MLSDEEFADFKLLLEQHLTEIKRPSGSNGFEIFKVNQKRLKVALYRIQDGTFGLCCWCGEEMMREQLIADPAALYCENCQDEI